MLRNNGQNRRKRCKYAKYLVGTAGPESGSRYRI